MWLWLALVVVVVVAFMVQRPATFYGPFPTSAIHANPDTSYRPPEKQPVPAAGTPAPSLPITSAIYATNPDLAAVRVRYISSFGTIEERCLKRVMADTIPTENIMPSSLDDHGKFKNLCAGQDTQDYKPWPF